MQSEAQKSQPKMNRSEFNNHLNFRSLQMQMQNDAPSDDKKLRRKMSKKKKYQDDEDFNIDMESSGEKLTTVFPTQPTDSTTDLNDTTIIFDQEQEE